MTEYEKKSLIKKAQSVSILTGEKAVIAQRKFIQRAKELKEMQYILTP